MAPARPRRAARRNRRDAALPDGRCLTGSAPYLPFAILVGTGSVGPGNPFIAGRQLAGPDDRGPAEPARSITALADEVEGLEESIWPARRLGQLGLDLAA